MTRKSAKDLVQIAKFERNLKMKTSFNDVFKIDYGCF